MADHAPDRRSVAGVPGRATLATVRLPLLLRLALALAAAALASGCDDLDAYATGPDEVYRGPVVGLVDPAVLRRGFTSEAALTLRFDPALATSLAEDEPPGVLSTSDGALTDVPLEPIVPLAHDVLGQYEIPSGDRVRNYVFVMRPSDGPLAGREPMVFMSLMGDGSIEVRIIAGGGSRDGDYFGLFRLIREPA